MYIQDNAFENAVWKMSATLSWLQCIKFMRHLIARFRWAIGWVLWVFWSKGTVLQQDQTAWHRYLKSILNEAKTMSIYVVYIMAADDLLMQET